MTTYTVTLTARQIEIICKAQPSDNLDAMWKREQVLRNELLRLRDVVCPLDAEAIDAALAERGDE